MTAIYVTVWLLYVPPAWGGFAVPNLASELACVDLAQKMGYSRGSPLKCIPYEGVVGVGGWRP